MPRLHLWLVLSLALSACDGVIPDLTGAGGGAGGGSANIPATDLPCDVATTLNSYCTTCHGSPLSGGAPMPMLTHADLVAPARSQPTKTVAQLSLERMQNAANPMPPAGNSAPTPADITAFQNWITAGMPAGQCGAPPTTCTSGQFWSGGNDGSNNMDPGQACIACHASSGGLERPPQFNIAGTVYPSQHEVNDCLGTGGVTVVITDANGATWNVPAYSSGNFHLLASLALPYHAKVVSASGGERTMSAAQTSGDCNSCHTQDGMQGAPGRIMAP